ncbi:hypothetical protein F4781DRAFT_435074 [Annulohypoxylon bovei var. microspora]|nr:hypothetical protein F4781DRAFT_435074 [Annulohypoxylon bovei var. microspora]
MKYMLALLSLCLTTTASPFSKTLAIEKRVLDVDQKITDDGHIPAVINSAWGDPGEEDLAAIAATEHQV